MNIDSIKNIISKLDGNIKKIVNLQKNIQAENKRLSLENAELKKIISIESQRNKSLLQRFHVLQMSKTLETGMETKDAKNRISEMIREIDKCIDSLKAQ